MEEKEMLERLNICVDRLGGPSKASASLGIPLKSLNNWRYGLREPKIGVIKMIAKATNVTTDWLLFGENGPDLKAALESPVQTLDPELHRWIIEGLAKLYKEIGLGMPPGEMGYKAAELHNEIIQEFSDLKQQHSALKLHLKLYRAELISQTVQPGKGEQESG